MKLKPCPFCGGKPEFIGSHKDLWIQCNCGCETSVYDTKEELIKFWNTRKGEVVE